MSLAPAYAVSRRVRRGVDRTGGGGEMSKNDGVSRRRVLAGAAAGAAMLAAPALAQTRPNVVIVGGGPGGARVARLLSESGAVDVTLINAQAVHTTGSLSNFYLASLRSLRSLSHALPDFAQAQGFRLIVDRVVAVDPPARQLQLAGGGALTYDRLVLAPGVSFQQDAVAGYDAVSSQAMPHAYAGGFQLYLLKRRLLEMRAGGLFAISAPPSPSRCASAPYERASLAAFVLSRVNPTAKIVIYDSKDEFPHRAQFEAYWAETYGGMIEWSPASFIGGGVVGVDARQMAVRLGSGDVRRVDAASVTPPQQAAGVAFQAGVVDADGWAPVDLDTMRSLLDPAIYVVGDCARLEPMPKTASAAVSQAGHAAAALLNEFDASVAPPPPLAEELWSYAGQLTSFRSGATYRPSGGGLRAAARQEEPLPNDDRDRLDQALEVFAWYRGMIADTYG